MKKTFQELSDTEILLRETLIRQSELIQALANDPEFGIRTRTGLELVDWPLIAEKATWVVFLDIDNMHRLNDIYTWDGASVRVRTSLCRHSSRDGHPQDVIGRWMSGDEIVIVLSHGDPQGLARSIQADLQANGISATFGIAPVVSPDLAENVKAAKDLVFQAKQQDRRGSINCLP